MLLFLQPVPVLRLNLIFLALFSLLLVALPGPALAQSATKPTPGFVRVRLETDMGNIVLALNARRAPKTVANFMIYVDDGRLDGTSFYRAFRRKNDPKSGFVQGGIDTEVRRVYFPTVELEPTDQTGLKHLDGTISMARHKEPNSGTGNFSIQVGANPTLDARPGYAGYAAFGQVVAGMDVVKRIMARDTCCGRGVMFGQMIKDRVTIKRAVRLDGTPKPSGVVKPWLVSPRGAVR
ncbi:peptidylprolyl isomerase [Sphingobium sp. B8D3D]|uniref:peptidylprolyl isomerase n=1 Tax=Sphingobium sp. B8D3D TaxID=2940587 RepID=UPI00222480ED|nr:peptidylprolyl isomerase [Sphingobium sp. B8D3D]MCW2413757.1 peptidyl-prolyl cis-trans isomerase A (cyclophilin A) [Sphingobium sp. B8D3A]